MSAGAHLPIEATAIEARGILATPAHQRISIPSARDLPTLRIGAEAWSLPPTMVPMSGIYHTVFHQQHAVAMIAAVLQRTLIERVAALQESLTGLSFIEGAHAESARGQETYTEKEEEDKGETNSFHSLSERTG